MGKALAYKEELISIVKELPRDSAKEVVDFARYLQWQSLSKKTFDERVDNLWVKMREQAEKAKYSLKDVSKFIAEVRRRKK